MTFVFILPMVQGQFMPVKKFNKATIQRLGNKNRKILG